MATTDEGLIIRNATEKTSLDGTEMLPIDDNTSTAKMVKMSTIKSYVGSSGVATQAFQLRVYNKDLYIESPDEISTTFYLYRYVRQNRQTCLDGEDSRIHRKVRKWSRAWRGDVEITLTKQTNSDSYNRYLIDCSVEGEMATSFRSAMTNKVVHTFVDDDGVSHTNYLNGKRKCAKRVVMRMALSTNKDCADNLITFKFIYDIPTGIATFALI